MYNLFCMYGGKGVGGGGGVGGWGGGGLSLVERSFDRVRLRRPIGPKTPCHRSEKV